MLRSICVNCCCDFCSSKLRKFSSCNCIILRIQYNWILSQCYNTLLCPYNRKSRPTGNLSADIIKFLIIFIYKVVKLDEPSMRILAGVLGPIVLQSLVQ